MSIRTVIVDDEPWARSRIATLLSAERDFEVVRECANVEQAVDAISIARPDVVFLDVQLRERTGFDVVSEIGPEAMPLVIFATAYDTYTLQAFDAQALDYLLKPFDEARFGQSLARVRKRLSASGGDQVALQRLLASMPRERKYLQRLAVSRSGRLLFVRANEVDWIEASGNYVTVHAGRDSYLLRDTLNALEARLDPEQFVRLHRSVIVNVDRIRQLEPWSRGEQVAVLADGTQLTVGRMYRSRLTAMIRNLLEG
jgi:two-component system LytT family response regulator